MVRMTGRELTATIFGARGSLPNPIAATLRYGGATTCLGIETPDGVPLIIDGGSGIYDLGLKILAEPREQHELHLFFTHTHWDHVQGLPFFGPFYDSSWTVHIHSLAERRASLRDIYTGVYGERYFPVPFDRLAANVLFHELQFEDRVVVGGATIRCCRVNHPGYALGFRVDYEDRSLFFASDAAPYRDMLFGDRFHVRKRERDLRVLDEMRRLEARVEALTRGVQLMFHDANYTDEEYEKLYHFGHASMTQAYELARTSAARHLVLWHHDRSRTDEQVDEITAPIIARGRQERLTVDPAQQGTSYHLLLGAEDIIRSSIR